MNDCVPLVDGDATEFTLHVLHSKDFRIRIISRQKEQKKEKVHRS